MGANLARNIARRGVPVAVHNRTPTRTTEFMEHYRDEGAFTPAESVEDFVGALERPRRIIVMVKAGRPVDGVIDELAPHLEPGDIVAMEGFGASAPAKVLYQHFGFTGEHVAERARAVLGR